MISTNYKEITAEKVLNIREFRRLVFEVGQPGKGIYGNVFPFDFYDFHVVIVLPRKDFISKVFRSSSYNDKRECAEAVRSFIHSVCRGYEAGFESGLKHSGFDIENNLS
jgi:hypothetical protein